MWFHVYETDRHIVMPVVFLCTVGPDGERHWPRWNERWQTFTTRTDDDELDSDVPPAERRRPMLPLEEHTEFVVHNQMLDQDCWVAWPDLDRTALRRLLADPSDRLPSSDRHRLIPELLARAVAPDTTVFSLLADLGQPFSLANGRVLQSLLYFWHMCQNQYTLCAAPLSGFRVPVPHDSTSVWWEGRMVSVDRWDQEKREELLQACHILLRRVHEISTPTTASSPDAADVVWTGWHSLEMGDPCDVNNLCEQALRQIVFECHGSVGPLTLCLPPHPQQQKNS